jgi:transcription elongation GreA/GreB family factor
MSSSERRQKFIELAEKRVTRAIKDIRLIGNLSNKTNYRYTDEDVKEIVSALQKELRDLKRRFTSSANPDQPTFSLRRGLLEETGDD